MCMVLSFRCLILALKCFFLSLHENLKIFGFVMSILGLCSFHSVKQCCIKQCGFIKFCMIFVQLFHHILLK